MGDPFEAKIVDGEIIARGSQDMKCVGAAQLAAIAKLRESGWDNPTRRDLYFAFTPEEEIGGQQGWGLFVDTPEFDALNVEFYMDEGIANEATDSIEVFYAERVGASCRITARGNAGHGSQFIQDTAGAKLIAFSADLLAMRDEQEQILASGVHPDGTKFALGDVTTINLTILGGGKQVNVVPNELEVTFDIRVTPHTPHNEFVAKLKALADKHGVEMTTLRPPVIPKLVPVSDPLYAKWWDVVAKEATKRGLEPRRRVFPAASDARYIRRKGIPALGCSVGLLRRSKIVSWFLSLIDDISLFRFSTSSVALSCSMTTTSGYPLRCLKRVSIGTSTLSEDSPKSKTRQREPSIKKDTISLFTTILHQQMLSIWLSNVLAINSQECLQLLRFPHNIVVLVDLPLVCWLVLLWSR